MLAGQAGQRGVQARVGQLPPHLPAAPGRLRRARPVERQRQLLRQPGQRLPPVPDLTGQDAARVLIAAEQVPLPQRVIGVLHRQRRPARRPAVAARRVRRRQVRHQHLHRPAVTGDVMAQQHQHMLIARRRVNSHARTGSSLARSNSCRAAASISPASSPGRAAVTVTGTSASPGGDDVLVGLAVRRRRTRCAATRAGPPRHPAPRPARRRRARRSAATRTAGYTPCPARGAAPGTTAAAARTTTAAAPAAAPGPAAAGPPPPRPAPRPATPASGARTPPGPAAPRPAPPGPGDTSRVASSECPPRSKKLSSHPDPVQAQHLREHLAQRLLPGGRRRPAAARRRTPGRAAPAGPASRSAISGSASSTTTADGTMYPGSARPHASRSPAGSSTAPAAGTTYPASRRSPGWSSRTATAACATPGRPASTASTSPSSIRNPRTFTWSSARPRYSSCPSAVHRARSPVRYIRSPGRTERARHEPLRGQPRPAQVPPRQPRPRHVQLPRHPRRHQAQPVVQHEHPRIPAPAGRSAATWPARAAARAPRRWRTPSSRSARTCCGSAPRATPPGSAATTARGQRLPGQHHRTAPRRRRPARPAPATAPTARR